MSNYVYSTLVSDQAYTTYVRTDPEQLSQVEAVVYIKGGSHVMARQELITPKGVRTEVTDEQLRLLEENSMFQMHVKNGYITVERRKAKMADVVKNMNDKDKSRPITPNDFEEQKASEPSKFKRKDV